MLKWLVLFTIFCLGTSAPRGVENDDDVTLPGPERIEVVVLQQVDVLLTRSNVSIQTKENITEMLRGLSNVPTNVKLRTQIIEGLHLWHGMCFNDKLSVLLAILQYEKFYAMYMGPVKTRLRPFFERNNFKLRYDGYNDIMPHLNHSLALMQDELDSLYRLAPETYREIITTWKGGFAEFAELPDYMTDRNLALPTLMKIQPFVLSVECMIASNDLLIFANSPNSQSSDVSHKPV